MSSVVHVVNKLTQTASATVTTSSVLLVAANPKRVGLILYNNSANSIYINFGSAANSSNALVAVVATFTTKEYLVGAVWTGDVYGIRNAGTGNVVVTELLEQ